MKGLLFIAAVLLAASPAAAGGAQPAAASAAAGGKGSSSGYAMTATGAEGYVARDRQLALLSLREED